MRDILAVPFGWLLGQFYGFVDAAAQLFQFTRNAVDFRQKRMQALLQVLAVFSENDAASLLF